MLNLNLEALGVTEKALEDTILSQLGLDREGAVKALADKFGVSLTSPTQVVKNGSTVTTDQGETKAAILSDRELSVLKEAAAISTRLFS